MVPWSLLEPNQTEKIAAVLLGRRHPRALRVRPAPGDGGIDVRDPAGDGRDDVYQIKWFPTALTESRERQIHASLNKVEQNVAVFIREWYLVSRERVDFTFAGCFRTMTYVVDCYCAGAAERPR